MNIKNKNEILKNCIITEKEFSSIAADLIDSRDKVFCEIESFLNCTTSKIYYRNIIDIIIESEEWDDCSKQVKEELQKVRIHFSDDKNITVAEYTFHASFNSSKNIFILYDANRTMLEEMRIDSSAPASDSMILKDCIRTEKSFSSFNIHLIDSENIGFAIESRWCYEDSKICYTDIIDMILKGAEWNLCSEKEKEKLEKAQIYFFDDKNITVAKYTFHANFNSSKNIFILYDANRVKLEEMQVK